jgi:hypothetical protein
MTHEIALAGADALGAGQNRTFAPGSDVNVDSPTVYGVEATFTSDTRANVRN